MNTYRIERVNRRFEVVVYEKRWLWEKRSVVTACDRLMDAEQMLLAVVAEEYSRKLDQDRFAAVTATIADCEARVSEEHIYTALVLQNITPPDLGDLIPMSIYDTAEKMLNKSLSDVEKRLFLHRFMTWYAKHTPGYRDPRLVPHDGEFNFAPPRARAGNPPMVGAMRRLVNAMTGRGR